jgi:hypothetical protein
MVGSRLGAICEAFAIFILGFLFGIFFNWKLTIIIYCSFLIGTIAFILYLQFNIFFNKQLKPTLDNANRVRFDCDSYSFYV